MYIYDELSGPRGLPERNLRWPLRLRSFFFSVAFHVTVLILLGRLPGGLLFQTRSPADSRRELAVLRPERTKIYWIPLKKTIPRLAPDETIPVDSNPAGRRIADADSIVVKQPAPVSTKQLVWQPDAPPLPETKTPLPNMVAIKGDPAPPPPAEAPAPKPKPREFIPPKQSQPAPAPPSVVVEVPPQVAVASIALAAPPSLAVTAVLPSAKVPPKKFVPPPRQQEAAPSAPRIELAPELQVQAGTGASITATVIDLRQSSAINTKRPDGARAGEFSTGPRKGAPAAAPGAGGVSVPGAAAQGRELSPPPPATLSPSPSSQGYELRIPASAGAMSAPLRPASRVVPRVVEERFPGRAVYAVLVQKPDLPEYAGDWTIWFADRMASGPTGTHMRAPYPRRKAIGSVQQEATPGAGSRGTIQMTAVIDELGRIGNISVLPGRYPQFAAKAVADLAAWEFRPANRNGLSVSVEVLIDIPFRVN